MSKKFLELFILSVGVIFTITGFAKIVSALGHAKVLSLADPIFGISFRHLMLFSGVLELVVAAVCVFTTRLVLSLSLVIWMATNFAAYRFGLWWIGWQRPCSCLGNITDALGISSQTSDLIMKVVLVYLLAGSLTILFWNSVLVKNNY